MIRRPCGRADRVLRRRFCSLISLVALASPAFAQAVRGRVVDPQGRAVPARRRARLLDGTSVITTAKTTGDGTFGPIAAAPASMT